MASKAKDEQEKESGNKYKSTGIVPPVVQEMIAGNLRTAKPEKLSPYQQKVLLRQSAR